MSILRGNVFDFESAVANVEIALREGDLDPGLAQFLRHREIEIAAVTPWPIAHFAAPDHQLKVD